MARLLTRIENTEHRQLRGLLKELFPHTGQATVIGVTGSSGVGKSTLVDRLASHYSRERGKVAVIAIDPSSPFSGGAILGDRIRMQSLATDSNVFVRSMATRGRMGGLSPSVDEAVLVLDAAGFRTLIVETVGVGQDEVDIVKTVHVVLVVVTPGMGDEVQTMKAGIMEIADIFVINKADREGAMRTERELKALLSISSREDEWHPPVVQTVATRGDGTQELLDALEKYHHFFSDPEKREKRGTRFFRARILEMLRDRLADEILMKIPKEELDRCAEKMMTRTLDPYTLMDRLLGELGVQEVSDD